MVISFTTLSRHLAVDYCTRFPSKVDLRHRWGCYFWVSVPIESRTRGNGFEGQHAEPQTPPSGMRTAAQVQGTEGGEQIHT